MSFFSNESQKVGIDVNTFSGATTFSITTLSLTTFSIMTLSLTTFSITTLRVTTFSITILGTKGLFVTLSINHIQHNTIYRVPLCFVSRFMHCYADCGYAECRYAECHGTFKSARNFLFFQKCNFLQL